jgi:ankyrin repeat protein
MRACRWCICLFLLSAQPMVADTLPLTQRWAQAIEQRNTELLKQLLPAIKNPDQQDSEGKTALMVAAIKADNELLTQLLDKDSGVDITNNRGGTALMYAAANNRIPAARILMQHNANINVRAENGWTALILAVAKGNHEMVRFLLNHGADPNIPDVQGWTALMRAIQHHRPRVIDLLVNNSKLEVDRINTKGQSALHIAAEEEDCHTLNLLIERGADRWLQDFRKQTASISENCGL